MAKRSQGPIPRLVSIHSENRLFRECLHWWLRSQQGDGLMVAPLDAADADIVVLDAAATGALARCSEIARSGRIVVLVNLGSVACPVAALRAGARGVLELQAGIAELPLAIRAVAEGRVWAPAGAVARALSLLSMIAGEANSATTPEHALTRRERETLGHTVGGLSNKEIADRMAIRTSTVKSHLTSVFRKLSVRDRTQLVVLYHDAGQGPPGPERSVVRGSYLRA